MYSIWDVMFGLGLPSDRLEWAGASLNDLSESDLFRDQHFEMGVLQLWQKVCTQKRCLLSRTARMSCIRRTVGGAATHD